MCNRRSHEPVIPTWLALMSAGQPIAPRMPRFSDFTTTVWVESRAPLMSTSLLEVETGRVEAESGNACSSQLDSLLADCLNWALDDGPSSAGRERSASGREGNPPHRGPRFSGPSPSERLDA